MQEVTKLAFDAAGLLQDSAESVGEELRGIQGAPCILGPEGARVGSRAPRPAVVSRSGEGLRPARPSRGHGPPGLQRGHGPPDPHGVTAPRPAAVMGRKLTELGWGRSVCLRKKTEQVGVSVAGGGP